ncbi:hypothetical protein Ciccas_006339, partial [Cichlidogyrus casuarinus]
MSVVIFMTCLCILIVRFSGNFLFRTLSGKNVFTIGSEDEIFYSSIDKYRSASEVSIYFAMLNSYAALMVFLYSPSKNALL